MTTETRNYSHHCKINLTFRSPRSEQVIIDDLINEWNKISKNPYKSVTFQSYDQQGQLIYHTDCMMTLLYDHAVISVTAIKDKKQRKRVLLELSNPPQNVKPYKILEITREQIEGMCANMFNLQDSDGNQIIIMSDRARRTHSQEKFQELCDNYTVLVANVDMIEHVGGGSTRCMLAERF